MKKQDIRCLYFLYMKYTKVSIFKKEIDISSENVIDFSSENNFLLKNISEKANVDSVLYQTRMTSLLCLGNSKKLTSLSISNFVSKFKIFQMIYK